MRMQTASRPPDERAARGGGGQELLHLGAPVDGLGSGVLVEGEWAGRRVLVRRLSVEGDARSRAHAVLLARELVGIDCPHLVPLIDVRDDWTGIDLVYEPPAASSLAGFLDRRPLTPAEVVGVGLAAGEALAALHDAGLTHGRLTAADLLVDAGGSVLVTGYGVAGVLGSAGSSSADVRDLLDLLTASMGDSSASGSERLRVLLRELAAVPELDAAGLLDALHDLPSAPLGLRRRPPEALVPRRPQHRARPLGLLRRSTALLRRLSAPRVGWRVLGGVLPAALGVLLLAGWLGASLPNAAGEANTGRPGAAIPPTPEQPAPTAHPTPEPRRAPPSGTSPPRSTAPPASPPDWQAVLAALNDGRSRLFAAPDDRRLAEVDAPGSSAYASDLALVHDLTRAGAAARGLRTDLVSVQVRTAGAARTDLTVVDVLRPYTIVRVGGGDAGQVLQQRLGRPARTTLVTLVRVHGQWRVAEVGPP